MEDELRRWKLRAEEEEGRNGGVLPGAFMDQWEAFQRRHLVKLEQELDACQGSCLLAVEQCGETMAGALKSFDKDRYLLHAFVIMPNHVHVAVTPGTGWELEQLLQSWKGFTARQINKLTNRAGPFWQTESYDRIVRDVLHFEKVVRYIANNPRKASIGELQSRLWFAEGMVEGDATGYLREEEEGYGANLEVW